MRKERINLIWDFLKTKEKHSSKTLLKFAKNNKINEMTFRRDLHFLEKNNLIRLYYGFVEVINTNIDHLNNFDINEVNNYEIKKNMAIKAVNVIEDGDSIFIGPGTTCEVLTSHINKNVDLLVTNGIKILSKSSINKKFKQIIMVGGKLLSSKDRISSLTSIIQIQDLRFDKIFITAQSIDENNNVYITDIDEYEFLKVIMKNANKKFLLVDSSKYNSIGNIKLCKFEDFDSVITDKN
ncbi:DeoR/GlpR family DNA-binding transcription regulator [Spiroplasma tabanidicola]|nr:DeoR/GlpR family DNA-binding transcription regulator [Spiroplasma tabanidicola]